jgi:hypothetical protein
MDEKALFERLDRIIVLLEDAAKKPTIMMRISNGIATGVGIMGIISIIDVIKNWLGG